jgi:hypothetical protein
VYVHASWNWSWRYYVRERAFCLSLLLISLSEQDSISIEKTFLVNMLVHRNGAMELMGANLELYLKFNRFFFFITFWSFYRIQNWPLRKKIYSVPFRNTTLKYIHIFYMWISFSMSSPTPLPSPPLLPGRRNIKFLVLLLLVRMWIVFLGHD